ncbi:MAG: metal-sensitive transcriptional regulator [Bacillota bacterium]|nr:metal-sensitive transcriptional regulator [Bacillota bacterium]
MPLGLTTVDDLCRRLESIEGHVRGVKRMAEQGKDCESLLVQLLAVRAAVDRSASIVLYGHVDHCLREAIQSGDQKAALAELQAVLRYLSP